MDLNFVDPPIEPGMKPFRPAVPAEGAEQAMHDLAGWIRSDELMQESWNDEVDRIAQVVERPAVARLYAEGVPFVARFLTVELDTENGVPKGIGRVTPGDPPPRFGDKYARRLRSAEDRERMAMTLEQLAFRGFALAAVANTLSTPPRSIDFNRPVEEWWRLFVRSLGPTYWGIELDPDKGMNAALAFTICRPAIESYVNLGEELKLARRLSVFGSARVTTYVQYFIGLGWTLYAARLDDEEALPLED